MSICVGKADRGRLMCSMKIILLALSLMLANVSAFISLSFSSRQFAGVNQFPHSHLNAMATEQEMENFFDANHQWTPLFKSLLVSSDAPASGLLGGFESGLIPDPSDASPWKERPIVPSDEDDKKVVGSFLDTMHKFLLDIPVTEGENTSSDDLFIEEGRRVLMIGRYRVLREGAGVSLNLKWFALSTMILIMPFKTLYQLGRQVVRLLLVRNSGIGQGRYC